MAFPEKPADTSVPIHELIAARWSPRAIDAERDLDHAQVLALAEAARWAPSCFGDEPWRFLFWQRSADADGWQLAHGLLAEGNRSWAGNAPLLIAACADSEFRRNGKPNRWGQHDTGAAAENLCLQAVAMGLVAHQMGGFDRKALAETFGIPERFTPMAMIAIGHPADAQVLPEEKREAELGPRQRRPLGENFYAGRWEQPLSDD